MLLFYQFSNMIYIITPLQDGSTTQKMYIVVANFSLFQFSGFFPRTNQSGPRVEPNSYLSKLAHPPLRPTTPSAMGVRRSSRRASTFLLHTFDMFYILYTITYSKNARRLRPQESRSDP